jgi:hypothetical protein
MVHAAVRHVIILASALAAAAAPCRAQVMTATPDSLHLELLVAARAERGQPIRMLLRIENRAGRTLDLYLRGRSVTFDVVVTDASGQRVWQRLQDEVVPAILQLRTLPAGGQITAEAVWDQRTNRGEPLPPGIYTARALLLGEDTAMATAPVSFRIADPG